MLQKCTFPVPEMRHESDRLKSSKGAVLRVQGGNIYGNNFKGNRS